ncbi:hypothetical protein KAR52_01390 [Candidatus Pacearchaeota archaeon]|nr:hypothetical protein [Candidatus Pacearchaeota archaeon]
MPFKINIAGKKGKTYHLESESEELIEKELNDKIDGKDILPDLEGYEFEITGASDKSGFTAMKNVEGIGLTKILLSYGKAMKNRPRKEGKGKLSKKKPKGLRLRKTVRGKIISPAISQINLKILKEGGKKLSEIFPEQNKAQEVPQEIKEEPKEVPKQETKSAEIPSKVVEEPKKAETEEKKE